MIPALFCFTAFFSACLLFQVQPMVGKSLLPWFGGAPAVWTTCLMFFQTLLFLGYGYAHLLTRRGSRQLQTGVHFLVLTAGCLFAHGFSGTAWSSASETSSIPNLLKHLSTHVAVPFFALAATSPLLQKWYAGLYPKRSPYGLYAVSNGGSMVGLLAYPFVVEPRLSIPLQGMLWSLGYLLFAVTCAVCGILSDRLRPHSGGAKEPASGWRHGKGAAQEVSLMVCVSDAGIGDAAVDDRTYLPGDRGVSPVLGDSLLPLPRLLHHQFFP